jgi:hypothetical protein
MFAMPLSRRSPRISLLFRGIVALSLPLAAAGCGEAFAVDSGAGGATASSVQGTGGSSLDTSSSDASGITSTSDASSATSASSASSGAGGAASEDCTNGSDDDADALVDCEDPDCVDFACVEEAPENWAGPVAFFYGLPASLPPCDAPWTSQTLFGAGSLDAPDAECSCSCATPQGATCTQSPVTKYGDASCQNPLVQLPANPPGQCANVLGGVAVTGGLSASPSVPVGGSCSPVVGENVPAAQFEFKAQVCQGAPFGGGCEPGKVCAPRAPEPFEPGLCVYREGTQPCPSGSYASPTSVYQSIVDSRDCGPCTCADPQKINCAGSTTLHSDLVCGNPVLTVPHDGTCVAFGGTFASLVYTQDGPDGGNCDPAGGKPTGVASPGPELTICCSF